MNRAAELLHAVAAHVEAHPDEPDQWWISDYGEDHGYDRQTIVLAIDASEGNGAISPEDAEGRARHLRMAALRVGGSR